MEAIKYIFRTLWACWLAFWFLLVVFIFTPIYGVILGIFGRKYAINLVWINCHYLSPFLLAMGFVRYRVHGKERIDPKATYVHVANHTSALDILLTAAAMPQPMKFLAKMEIKKIPMFGYMTQMLAIMVDRKNEESRKKSLLYMVQELKQGNSILLYPEGTRNRTDNPLKEFKDGAFRTAIMAQVPIAVQTIVGAKELNPPQGLQLSPGTVDIYWGKPIPTTGMTIDDVERLKEIVRQEMLSHLS
jgi:1-acyl-sn-glycerol-3-phosphate acyltransferase